MYINIYLHIWSFQKASGKFSKTAIKISCACYFSHICDHTPEKSNTMWRSKGSFWVTVWGHSPSQQERQVGSGHIASVVGWQRKMNTAGQFSFSINSAWDPSLRHSATHVQSRSFLLCQTFLIVATQRYPEACLHGDSKQNSPSRLTTTGPPPVDLTVPLTFRMGLPYSNLWKHSHRHTQKCFMMILSPTKLTMKISHHVVLAIKY